MSGKSTAWLLAAAVLVQLASSQAHAATRIEKKADGSLEVTACEPGMKDGERVAFKVGNKESIAQSVAIKGGCAVKTYSAGIVSPGTKIIIEYSGKTLEAFSPTQSLTSTQTGSPVSTQPTQPTVPTATQRPTTPGTSSPGTTTPALKSADVTQVRANAREDARQFVSTVVRVFGQVENVRYNLYKGARNAETLIQSTGGRVEDTPDFKNGLARAYNDGRAESRGFDAGRAAGREVGAQMGAAAAQTRFAQAAANESAPDLQPGTMNTTFNGLRSDLGTVRSVEARMSDFDQRLQNEMRGQIVWGDGIILGDDFYVRSLRAELLLSKDYRDDLLLDGWRGENAFNAWFNQRLTTKFNSDIQYFRNISDSMQYANAIDARRAFMNAFIEEYDRTLNEQWNRTITKRNDSAFAMGQLLFVEARNNYARDLGYKQGYDEQFQAASVRGYQETSARAYSESFEITVRKFKESSVIADLKAALVVATTGSASDAAVLDVLDLSVLKITNQGMKPADLQVRVQGQGLREGQPTLLKVPGVKSLTNIQLSGVAQIMDGAAPNSVVRITAMVGDQQITQDIRVSWAETVRKLARTQGEEKRIILQYVTSNLAKEFTKLAGVGNEFDDKDNHTLIQQFALAFKTLSPAERSAIKAEAEAIKAAYGKRPSGWFTTTDDDWDTCMAILQDIGF